MLKKTLLSTVLALSATGAFAQAYVQANVGSAKVSLDCTDCKQTTTGTKLLAGYGFGNGLAVEAQYIDYGKKTNGLKSSGAGLNLAYLGKFDNQIGYRVAGGLWQTKLDNQANTTSTNGSVGLSAGLSYDITPNMAVVGEYDWTPTEMTFALPSQTSSGNSGLFSVGLRYKF